MNLIRSVPQSRLAYLLSFVDQLLRRWTAATAQPSFVLDSRADLARPKRDLILEKALLRQQLVILHRQVK